MNTPTSVICPVVANARIDRLVYDLYGLTEEEIKIVEGIKSGSEL